MKIQALLLSLLAAATTQAQTWNFDAAHSSIGFAIKHLAVSTVHGEFDKFDIKLAGDPAKPTTLQADVTIQATSVDTKSEARDKHLRTPDFFDVAKDPVITFKSEKVEAKDGKYLMTGTLTMHGIAKKVAIPFEVSGPVTDPYKNVKIGLEGTLTVERQDYAIGSSFPAAILGNDVKIEISAEFAQAPAAK
jgi:polyisoprenoid-binding protein YceI